MRYVRNFLLLFSLATIAAVIAIVLCSYVVKGCCLPSGKCNFVELPLAFKSGLREELLLERLQGLSCTFRIRDTMGDTNLFVTVNCDSYPYQGKTFAVSFEIYHKRLMSVIVKQEDDAELSEVTIRKGVKRLALGGDVIYSDEDMLAEWNNFLYWYK